MLKRSRIEKKPEEERVEKRDDVCVKEKGEEEGETMRYVTSE